MNKKYWIALIKSGGKYYVASTPEGEVAIELSKKKMSNAFTNKYLANHFRSREASISSLMNNLQLSPSIIQMSIEEMGENLFDLKKGTKNNYLHSISGSIYALTCNRNKKNIEKIFENGTKPDLVPRDLTD
jgi:hypothetical protein